MALLAAQDTQALRHLLERPDGATLAEVQLAAGMGRDEATEALTVLERTGLATRVTGTPGLGSGRWVPTAHAHQVGWSLVENPMVETDVEAPAEPAAGWGFPWKPSQAEAPVYATALSRRARRDLRRTRERSTSVSLDHTFRSSRWRLMLLLAVVLTLAGAVAVVQSMRRVGIDISGIENGTALQPDSIIGSQIEFAIDGVSLDSARMLLDGFPVSGVQRYGNRVAWRVPPLTEGPHEVSITVDRPLFGSTTRTVSFEVDGTPPELGLPEVHEPVPLGQPVMLTGQAEDGVSLVIAGVAVEIVDGAFAVELSEPPASPIPVLAIDRAGNTTSFDMVFPIAYPTTTGVHMSAASWRNDRLRGAVLELIDQGKITAVEFSLKDESGMIGYRSDIPLANEAGAVIGWYDLEDVVADLHSRGVRVIGRLVAFRDPVLAQHAWNQGNSDWVIQGLNGLPLSRYGGFTNFNHEAVRQYNLDIATEAAQAGVDDILWDYIRRPEGRLDSMIIPGMGDDDPAPVIVDFLAQTQRELRRYDVFQGVSVFGISATRGEFIAQDVVGMAKHVDFIAPMLYPSHWGAGEYGVAHPEGQPYDIIKASLADFQRVLEGTNTTLVPWLQDFTMRVEYGPDEIRAQIEAAADLGIADWLLWDPEVTYTSDGMDPMEISAGS